MANKIQLTKFLKKGETVNKEKPLFKSGELNIGKSTRARTTNKLLIRVLFLLSKSLRTDA